MWEFTVKIAYYTLLSEGYDFAFWNQRCVDYRPIYMTRWIGWSFAIPTLMFMNLYPIMDDQTACSVLLRIFPQQAATWAYCWACFLGCVVADPWMGWILNTLGCVAYVVVIVDEIVLVCDRLLLTSQPALKGYSIIVKECMFIIYTCDKLQPLRRKQRDALACFGAMETSVDWDQSMILDEIKTMREQYNQQVAKEEPSPKFQWEFACTLACSPRYADVIEAVELLEELVEVGFRRVDCLHHLILANLKIGQYAKAKDNADVWLHLEPDNGVARMMYSVVVERASHDGWIAWCGFALLATGLIAAWLRRK